MYFLAGPGEWGAVIEVEKRVRLFIRSIFQLLLNKIVHSYSALLDHGLLLLRFVMPFFLYSFLQSSQQYNCLGCSIINSLLQFLQFLKIISYIGLAIYFPLSNNHYFTVLIVGAKISHEFSRYLDI